MFNTFNGLPLHALAVHGAVVLIPITLALGLMFAVPRTRSWARTPLALTSLAALAATFVARQSGQALKEAGGQFAGGLGGDVGNLVDQHQEAANLLFYFVIVYAVVACAAWLLTRSTGSATRVGNGLSVLLVIGVVVLGYQTYRVGDLGARAVWNPSDSVDYSSGGGE